MATLYVYMTYISISPNERVFSFFPTFVHINEMPFLIILTSGLKFKTAIFIIMF